MHTSVHAETEKKNHKQTDLYAMSMLTVHFEMREKNANGISIYSTATHR